MVLFIYICLCYFPLHTAFVHQNESSYFIYVIITLNIR